uniref:Protein kinase domain-containing protein n=1 Tax=Periophthalmus magnuspinnatus TaxID=409849 RepID=A0A3B3ZNI7_9GOBI
TDKGERFNGPSFCCCKIRSLRIRPVNVEREEENVLYNNQVSEQVDGSISRSHVTQNGLRELEMLEHISPVFNLVKFIEFFDFQDRQSMVFEMLDISVYDLMQEEFPFSLSQARPVAKQLLIALQGLQDIAVIHADIKPDNIMLVNHREQPFKVKLIDFGVAKRSDQVYPGQMMQPISVRAPEVRLGLPLWELANFIGTPAKELLDEHSIYNLEELIKRSREFVSEQESNDRDAFHDLLSKMLEINAEKRITPAQALLHPFITMDHLPKGDNYTKEAHELMRVAETMYGPLQRENLEKIAEKQKEEAIARFKCAVAHCDSRRSHVWMFYSMAVSSTSRPQSLP